MQKTYRVHFYLYIAKFAKSSLGFKKVNLNFDFVINKLACSNFLFYLCIQIQKNRFFASLG